MKYLLEKAIEASILAGKAILKIYRSEFTVDFKTDNSPLTQADRASHQIIVNSLSDYGFPVLSEEGLTIDYNDRKNWKEFWLVDPLDGTKEFVKRNGDFTVNIALVKEELPIMGVIFAPVNDELYFGDIENGAFKVVGASKFVETEKLMKSAISLPLNENNLFPIVVASRSHMNDETAAFIEELKETQPGIQILSRGSSLKICMVAENAKTVYPRFAPTYEWDTAAGHAILRSAGGNVVMANVREEELKYNKENLLNPWFIAFFKTK